MKRITVAVTGLVVMALSGVVAAQTPFSPSPQLSESPLPSFAPEVLAGVFLGDLRSLVLDTQWVCGAEARRRCECVTINGGNTTFVIATWTEDARRVSWTGVAIVDHTTGSHYQASEVVLDVASGRVEIRDLLYFAPSESEGEEASVVLTMEYVDLENTHLRGQGLTWRRRARSDVSGCPTRPSEALATEGQIIAQAATGEHDGRRWIFTKMKMGPVPIALTSVGDGNHGGQSGWLPPALLMGTTGAEFESGYYVAGARSSISALVSWPGTFGIGFSHYSRGSGLGTSRFERLRLDLRHIAQQKAFAVSALGTSRVGEESVHLSIDAEWPATEELWGLHRLERGAAFRSWQLSRAGLSLSSPGHFLQLQSAHLVDGASKHDEFSEALTTTRVVFASRYGIGERAQLQARAVALGVDGDDADFAYISTQFLWQLDLGAADRLYLRPWASADLNYQLRAVDGTAVVDGLGRIHVGAEGGLGLEGRFSKGRHRLRPRLVALTEIATLEEFGRREGNASAGLDSGRPMGSGVGSGVEGLRLVATILEQGWVGVGGWQLTAPLAIFWMGEADRDPDFYGAGLMRLSSPRSWKRPWQGRLALSCRRDCETSSVEGRMQWMPFTSWTLAYQMARTDDPSGWLAISLLNGGAPALLATTAMVGGPVESAGWFYRPSLALGLRRARIELGLPGDLESGDPPGVEVHLQTGSSLLGWHFGLDGAYDPRSGSWMGRVGLSL